MRSSSRHCSIDNRSSSVGNDFALRSADWLLQPHFCAVVTPSQSAHELRALRIERFWLWRTALPNYCRLFHHSRSHRTPRLWSRSDGYLATDWARHQEIRFSTPGLLSCQLGRLCRGKAKRRFSAASPGKRQFKLRRIRRIVSQKRKIIFASHTRIAAPMDESEANCRPSGRDQIKFTLL